MRQLEQKHPEILQVPDGILAIHPCCSGLFLFELVFPEPVITMGSTNFLRLHADIYSCVRTFFLIRLIVFITFIKASKQDPTHPC